MSVTETRKVEFGQTARAVHTTRDGKNAIDLVMTHYARVWPASAAMRGKPAIILVGDTFPELLDSLRLWDETGRPSYAEAIQGEPYAANADSEYP